MVEFINVNHFYKKKQALKDVNLKIEDGSFNLFIGTNGSGKTTTTKIILKLLKNTNGKVINDFKKYSYMPEKTLLPDYITIDEFLRDLSYLSRNCDYEKYLEFFNIDKSQMIYSLSKGNKQKVALIQMLMEDSNLYVLDEPTNGLDQESIGKLIKVLKELNKRGKTIIVVTHYKKLFQRWKIKRYEFDNGEVNEIL